MRKVTRIPTNPPSSLARKTSYKEADVKKALKEMYHKKCCYCEGIVKEAQVYGHVEHRKPKDKDLFPEYEFDLNNLHWCCPPCNINKGKKWDYDNPILDATVDNPEEHLLFNAITAEVEAKTDRGSTTIDHPKLNRVELTIAREKVIDEVNKLILMASKTKDINTQQSLKSHIMTFIKDEAEYSALMKEVVKKYL